MAGSSAEAQRCKETLMRQARRGHWNSNDGHFRAIVYSGYCKLNVVLNPGK